MQQDKLDACHFFNQGRILIVVHTSSVFYIVCFISNIMEDVLLGRDEEISFSDYLGVPENCEQLRNPHVMVKKAWHIVNSCVIDFFLILKYN